MASNFPTSLDALTNPAATDPVTSPSHSAQHTNINDIAEAIEAKVGIDSSAVTTSHDYKLSGVTGTDKAVSKTGTETLTAKTLTSPKIGTSILDTNGNELVKITATGGAINEVTLVNAAISGSPSISATGDDTDISLDIKAKGTGKVKVGTALLQLPNADGTNGQVIKTNGSAVLSFVDQATAPAAVTLIPRPNFINTASLSVLANAADNTIMKVGQIVVPNSITVNKISFWAQSINVAGTCKVGLYSEDGQTKVIDVTTASISGDSVVTTAVSSVEVTAGVYYVFFVTVSTTNLGVFTWTAATSEPLKAGVTSEPILEGTVTVTAGTPPATITPSSVSDGDSKTLYIRLDN